MVRPPERLRYRYVFIFLVGSLVILVYRFHQRAFVPSTAVPADTSPIPGSEVAQEIQANCQEADYERMEIDLEDTKYFAKEAAPAFPLEDAWVRPEAPSRGRVPRKIPSALEPEYLLDGRVHLKRGYYWVDESNLGGTAIYHLWETYNFMELKKRATNREQLSDHNIDSIYEALDRWAAVAIRGKSGLVIGPETPWLEATLLAYGAARVTTLDFGRVLRRQPEDCNELGCIQLGHHLVATYSPQRLRTEFIAGQRPFDFAFAYARLEHDGLGRYGDPLNPNADLYHMARLLRVVKPGGFMFLGVPCCADELYWNSYRTYGPARYSSMFAGWRVLGSAPSRAMESRRGKDKIASFRPIWTLQNPANCSIKVGSR